MLERVKWDTPKIQWVQQINISSILSCPTQYCVNYTILCSYMYLLLIFILDQLSLFDLQPSFCSQHSPLLSNRKCLHHWHCCVWGLIIYNNFTMSVLIFSKKQYSLHLRPQKVFFLPYDSNILEGDFRGICQTKKQEFTKN